MKAKTIKRSLCLILGAILCLGLFAACGNNVEQPNVAQPSTNGSTAAPVSTPGTVGVGAAATEPAPEGAKYREDITVVIDASTFSTVDVYNPACNTSGSNWTFTCIFDRLLTMVNDEITPELATEWSTDDYKNFHFKLRDDVYFHNGEKFAADDVVYTMERATAAVGTAAYDRLRLVESVEVVNDYEINIILSDVNVEFPMALTMAHSGIVNREACEVDAENGTRIGTGPWKIADFVPNDRIQLTRNDEYWGELPKTKNLCFRQIAENSAKYIMLDRGEAQVLGSFNKLDLPKMQSDERFQFNTYVVNNGNYVGFNMNDPICSDINFRRAVACAIPREDMALAAPAVSAKVVTTGGFWGYATPYKNTDLPILPHDVEMAKEYLAKSSYNGETVEIVNPGEVDAEILQQALKEVGINTSLKATDFAGMAAYATYENNQAQIILFTGRWQTPASARTFFYPGAATNRTSYNNPEVTKLLDEAYTEINEAKREEMYKKVQEYVAEDLPYIGINHIEHWYVSYKGVGGIVFGGDSTHDFSYIYMIEE